MNLLTTIKSTDDFASFFWDWIKIDNADLKWFLPHWHKVWQTLIWWWRENNGWKRKISAEAREKITSNFYAFYPPFLIEKKSN
jgi:hypothetical protein